MKQLVGLRIKPSRDGKRFTYFLDYRDENNKRRRISLGHADKRKAERQRTQKERELRMGIVAPESMKLSIFLEDSLARTGDQIRQSTQQEHRCAMRGFIGIVGDIDIQRVTLRHGEAFRQKSMDAGGSPSTAKKKLKCLKRLFQLAVERGQLDENPLRYIDLPKCPRKKTEVYTIDECKRIIRAAAGYKSQIGLRWDMLIITALDTAMRRGELLNLTWADIDFKQKTVEVSPKENTSETWEWRVKDTDRRTLPLTDDVLSMLAEHQGRQPEKHPYVFVPPRRYGRIQQLREKGQWSYVDSRVKVLNNFNTQFKKFLKRAGVKREGTFHDLRSTALTNWLRSGMSEYDVMALAGHASFDTTHRFYLAVADDLVSRARAATAQNLARAWHAPHFVVQKC